MSQFDQQETDRNQFDLFGVGNENDQLIKKPILSKTEEWSEKESLSKEMEIPITYKRKNRRRKFYKKSTLVKRLTTRYLNSVKNGKYNKRK